MEELLEIFLDAKADAVERTLPWVLLALTAGNENASPPASVIVRELMRCAGADGKADDAIKLSAYADRNPPDAELMARVIRAMETLSPDASTLRRSTDALLGLETCRTTHSQPEGAITAGPLARMLLNTKVPS